MTEVFTDGKPSQRIVAWAIVGLANALLGLVLFLAVEIRSDVSDVKEEQGRIRQEMVRMEYVERSLRDHESRLRKGGL